MAKRNIFGDKSFKSEYITYQLQFFPIFCNKVIWSHSYLPSWRYFWIDWTANEVNCVLIRKYPSKQREKYVNEQIPRDTAQTTYYLRLSMCDSVRDVNSPMSCTIQATIQNKNIFCYRKKSIPRKYARPGILDWSRYMKSSKFRDVWPFVPYWICPYQWTWRWVFHDHRYVSIEICLHLCIWGSSYFQTGFLLRQPLHRSSLFKVHILIYMSSSSIQGC